VRAGITGSGPFIGSVKAGAASGMVPRLRSAAASGDIVVPKKLDIAGGGFLSLPYSVRGRAMDSEARAWAAERRSSRGKAIKPKDNRLVAFPVLVTHPSIEGILDAQLYAASNVDYRHFHPEARQREHGYFVQGTDTIPEVRLDRNVYLFPIDAQLFPHKIVPVDGPIVTGHSCDAAIWLVCNGKFIGTLPYAVTGGVNGFLLRENDFFPRKLEYARQKRFSLAGNSPLADVIVEDLNTVRSIPVRQGYLAN